LKRAELYRVYKGSRTDPKKSRVFVIVSRQVLIESSFSTVVCAPIYSSYDGLATQVLVGTPEGLKRESSVHCDELISIPKSALTDFIATIPASKVADLDNALAVALGIGRIENLSSRDGILREDQNWYQSDFQRLKILDCQSKL
jgi:mRNA interferase MazF